MTAPAEPRQEDTVQVALAGVLARYEATYGPLESWSEAVWASYRTDLYVTRRRSENWAVAL